MDGVLSQWSAGAASLQAFQGPLLTLLVVFLVIALAWAVGTFVLRLLVGGRSDD
jgi:hypothetical protein